MLGLRCVLGGLGMRSVSGAATAASVVVLGHVGGVFESSVRDDLWYLCKRGCSYRIWSVWRSSS